MRSTLGNAERTLEVVAVPARASTYVALSIRNRTTPLCPTTLCHVPAPVGEDQLLAVGGDAKGCLSSIDIDETLRRPSLPPAALLFNWEQARFMNYEDLRMLPDNYGL